MSTTAALVMAAAPQNIMARQQREMVSHTAAQ